MVKKNWLKIKKVYLSGIGGIGVSALARFFHYHGISIIGTEICSSSITDNLELIGIKINRKHLATNITTDIDLFIHTPAISTDNPELLAAQKLNIPVYSYPAFLGELSKQYKTIAVSGTHGKSTTTSLVGLFLTAGKIDPTIIVGSQVNHFDHNFRYGQSPWLVVEACEYRGHMLYLQPEIITITNLEADHLDYYRDLNDIVKHFEKFIRKLKSHHLCLNVDDPTLRHLATKNECLTYGIEQQAKLQARNIKIKDQKQCFDLYYANKKIISLSLSIPGRFNIYNTLAAIASTWSFKLDPRVYQHVLQTFAGCWRRFEILGSWQQQPNTLVISDYAHHPTAVAVTIKAAKEFYPHKRLVVVFQPHQVHRTLKLFKEFSQSFTLADELILCSIYGVVGRENDKESKEILIDQLATACRQESKVSVRVEKNISQLTNTIESIIKANDLILIIGAGSIDQTVRQYLKI
ncbi:MAG: UDP-N-acetylmuramate--L-alanine ligase [Candidatus Komeilibacteria bacterium CG_4_10_14_0_2_um_filter_37_10]|uniref:UDP-N-acetylmuramate--L-alanine ligase n=1 Tax=Candidatus Komeilibacteria bacterium CG_4_10_14_0_2_um_filter_37_10 TaxID=1974470 RepID=A0A2M7VDU1_9BACT|nr:MAG: UDP-N-acetylmuramate--L-alanine ligase [Candidatus Komeilibacteria bacterium CG_4_10_14_0_2_um_filter_37_10]